MKKIYSTRSAILRVCDSVQLGNVMAPCLTGQVGVVDEVSQNGYRYKKGFWDKVLSDSVVLKQIEERNMLGTVEHPQDDESYIKTPYEDASHVVIKAWVQDGNPYATFAILNNPKGNAIKALVDIGHKPGVSTRGLGEILRDDISEYVSDEDYALIVWDIVRNPNFSTLKMSQISDSVMKSPLFQELCQMHGLKDSGSTDYNRDNLLSDMETVKTILKRMESFISK